MRRGDIVLIPFPFTDLSGQKVRPALVLFAAARGEDCIVAFISSRPTRKPQRFEIAITASKRNGLKFDSMIKVAKMATLQKKIIIGNLGAAESDTVSRVESALTALFGI